MRFAARRAGEHVGRLSLLTLVVVLVITGIGGLHAVAERMLTDGASRILTDAEPAARTIRVVANETTDETQDSRVRDAIATAFSETEVVVSRQASVEAALKTPTVAGASIRLLDDDRLPDLAVLTDGEWPLSPGQIALPEAAAQRQRLSVGDTVMLARDGTIFTLVGTWTANDPTGSAWHGDPAVASGKSDGAIGPAVVTPGSLSALPATSTITWEITPTDTGPTKIAALQRALTALRDVPDAVDPQRQHNTRILGGLSDTLHRQSSAIAATRGLLVAPLLIIAFLGALVLGITLSTLSIARNEELVLLRARGASRRRLALAAAVEAATVAIAGAVLALAVLTVMVGLTATALLTAASAAVFMVVASSVLTMRSAGRADIGSPEALRSDAGVRILPVLLLPAGIAVAVAALASWQLFTTGTVVRSDGTPDPLAAAAPALLLVAVCVLTPVAAAPLAALSERLLRRTRGTAPILPLRQIARRMGSVAVAILCLALAAASVALAIAAPVAAESAEQRARTAMLGGDVRMISDDGLDVTASTAAAWSGVTAAAEVLSTPLTVGSDSAQLVAGPPDALGFATRIPAVEGDTIGVGITRTLADRLGAEEATIFTARIRSVARPVSLQVVRIVDALPGVGSGLGVAAPPAELQAAGAELPADELWLRSDTPVATAAQLRAHATHPVRILTAAQVSAAPVTSIAPLLLTVGALVTAALGIIGFFAASSATARARSDEPSVLRALGLRPWHQRALRIGETASVAVYALLAGGALGAGVAAAVLPIVLGVGA